MEQLQQILQLKLINRKERPTYAYQVNGIEIVALFDSGATVPVWCIGEKTLLKAYPDAVKINRNCQIKGFGKENEECLIYEIPEFVLSNDDIYYRIKKLQIAVCKKPEIGCSLIMSDTMFSKTDTFIKRRGNKLLEIYFDKEEYICTPKYFELKSGLSISVWTQ